MKSIQVGKIFFFFFGLRLRNQYFTFTAHLKSNCPDGQGLNGPMCLVAIFLGSIGLGWRPRSGDQQHWHHVEAY